MSHNINAGSRTRNYINSKLHSQYGKIQPLTAAKFMEIWNHYDQDGNQYLEEYEIDKFLKDFLNSSLTKSKVFVSDNEALELKNEFLKEFDANKDGKISITELSAILPTKERFFLLYRLDTKLEKGLDYMKIWKKYDRDLSGYIEVDELKLFLRDLILRVDPQAQINERKLQKDTETIMEVFDDNKDGRLELSELVHLLPKEENFVQLVLDKAITLDKLHAQDVDLLIKRYDKDRSGTLEGHELDNFISDCLATSRQLGFKEKQGDVEEVRNIILKGCDLDHNGRINGKELSIVLLAMANASRDNSGRVTNEHMREQIRVPTSGEKFRLCTIGSDCSSAYDRMGPQDNFTEQVKVFRKNMHLMSYMPAYDD